MSAPTETAGDKLSPDQDFQIFVDELKTAKLRGEESVRDAVLIINRFQAKFGDSKKELRRLATAVGVDVRTLYRLRRITTVQK